MSNTHLAKKTSGDDTSVRGTQAVSLSASYKTHTKCLNNWLLTVSTIHEMIINFCQFEKKNQIYFFILDGCNRFSSYRYESCEYQFTREQNSLMILIWH